MPRSATDGNVVGETHTFSLETTRRSGTATPTDSLGEAVAAGAMARAGPKRWSVVALSVLSSALAVAAVGCVCAFIYPIIKDLRAVTVRREDGTEVRVLGFWSILVLSALAGSVFCVFSWTLTYMDLYRPGKAFSKPVTMAHFRDVFDQDLHMGYIVVVLNGVMAMLTVAWSLT